MKIIKIILQKFHPLTLVLPAVVFFTGLSISTGFAQGSDFALLEFRNSQPNIYVSLLTLPIEKPNTVQLTAIFRIDYNLLSFKKLNKPGEAEYYSTVSLAIELFKSPEKNLDYDEEVSLVNLESAGRAYWQDTVYASSYEATTSDSKFAIGSMQLQLQPGYYTYVIKLTGNNGSESQTSNTRNIRVHPYENSNRGEIILVGNVDESGNEPRLNLVNRGNNVLYRNDFYAFVQLPDYSAEKSYRLNVNQLRIVEEDTTVIEPMFQETISQQQIHIESIPTLGESGDELVLNLQNDVDGYTYALVRIPNQSFPNKTYKIEVIDSSSEQVVAEKVYHSLWKDIPTALLDLDIAIEMLRFIAGEETIDRIDNGSYQDREENFSAFWKERDPTPNTEFNELKVEYYRRIDYAYEHYSSQGTLGFETDRGEIYIVYGPPNEIDRVYPTDGATREIWTYDNRRFIFKATSGFGDFVLISN